MVIDETRKLILKVCKERGYTVAVAESCTGGLIGGALTDIPGSTAYFLGGVVVYSNLMKQDLIHVPNDLLKQHGSVSEPVAIAMATGVREVTGATWALSATGIAGPGVEGSTKPVGLVYIGCAGPDFPDGSANAIALKNLFDGDRDAVRQQTVQRALNLLLERIGELDA